MTKPGRPKLDSRSRYRLTRLLEGDQQASRRVALIVQGAAPFSAEQLDQLKNDGATIRSAAKAICTIDVPLPAVDRVLEHEFITAAEISSSLFGEQP